MNLQVPLGKKSVIILLVLAIIAVGLIYLNFNPTASNLFPKCTFLTLTGLKCPGCGTQRALHALLNGELCIAWHYNAMLLLLAPYLVFLLLVEIARKKKPSLYEKINNPVIVIVTVSLVLLWWITRNVFGW